MKTRFYIDRAFGHQIWINVENGKITDFPHEGDMEDILNERYKGFDITKFKEVFEEAFKGTYHNVQPDGYNMHKRNETNCVGQRNYWSQCKVANFPVFSVELCDAQIKKYDDGATKARIGLKEEEENLLKYHNFKVYKVN